MEIRIRIGSYKIATVVHLIMKRLAYILGYKKINFLKMEGEEVCWKESIRKQTDEYHLIIWVR